MVQVPFVWDKRFKRNDDLNVGMFLGQFERILPFYMKFSVCPNCPYARITPGHYIYIWWGPLLTTW